MCFERDPEYNEPIVVGLLSAAFLWAIYGTIRLILVPIVSWVAKGFLEDNNKNIESH
jgi:hypothetical protein